jgi:hypothetical protein
MSTSYLLSTKMLLATDGSEEADWLPGRPSRWPSALTPSCTWSMSNRCPTS